MSVGKISIFFNKLASFLFPAFCIRCKKEKNFICKSCLEKIRKAKTRHDLVFSVFNYEDKYVSLLLKLFKFHNKLEILENIGESVYEFFIEDLADIKTFYNFDEPILVPVPLTKKKLKKRGVNQSKLIANMLSYKSGFPVYDCLYKNRETAQQSKIKDREERFKNVSGCFSLSPNFNIKNKNVILIDDIVTTGATLEEARKVLLKNGAKNVICFTIAG